VDNKPFNCLKVASAGTMPRQVENAEITLTVANPYLTTATLLDPNGMATKDPAPVDRRKGKLSLRLPPNTMYLVLSSAKVTGEKR
jgi:hypothetical protein